MVKMPQEFNFSQYTLGINQVLEGLWNLFYRDLLSSFSVLGRALVVGKNGKHYNLKFDYINTRDNHILNTPAFIIDLLNLITASL